MNSLQALKELEAQIAALTLEDRALDFRKNEIYDEKTALQTQLDAGWAALKDGVKAASESAPEAKSWAELGTVLDSQAQGQG